MNVFADIFFLAYFLESTCIGEDMYDFTMLF